MTLGTLCLPSLFIVRGIVRLIAIRAGAQLWDRLVPLNGALLAIPEHPGERSREPRHQQADDHLRRIGQQPR